MIKIINRCASYTLLIISLFMANTLFAEEAQLKQNPPQKYYVKNGDTLWDISQLFLENPWAWPEIWHINNQVTNPHLIYPGDEISLVYIDEEPKITVTKRDPGIKTLKLSPEKRAYQISSTIPTIPLEAIESFLTHTRVVDKNTLQEAPYIIAADEKRIVIGKGDIMYAMGDWTSAQKAYGIYRPGDAYIDPVTQELLGYEARDIGMANYIRDEDEVATFRISRAEQEIRAYDRLLPTETIQVEANFYPKTSKNDIKGQIIRVFSGVKNIGQYDVVVINKGSREGLEKGDVFAIFRTGATVRDKEANDQKVKLPDERSGMLMVFRTHEKVSLALVLNAKNVLSLGDRIARP